MKIRVTGILIKNKTILLLKQRVNSVRSWSLPGGKVEENETLENALVREIKEETGLDIIVGKLLYVCDHITAKQEHVLHITFEISSLGGNFGVTQEGLDVNPIFGMEFVPLKDITQKGFSKKFSNIVESGFPGAGSYMGPKSSIGL
jgi:ADP-ribose pyrophosphatase YjhB (NUDIX family)